MTEPVSVHPNHVIADQRLDPSMTAVSADQRPGSPMPLLPGSPPGGAGDSSQKINGLLQELLALIAQLLTALQDGKLSDAERKDLQTTLAHLMERLPPPPGSTTGSGTSPGSPGGGTAPGGETAPGGGTALGGPNPAGGAEQPQAQQKIDQLLQGLLGLLIDLLGAAQDGKLSAAERAKLGQDLAGMLAKLLDQGGGVPVANSSPNNTPSDPSSPSTGPRPNQVGDGIWFFHNLGLREFLAAFYSGDSNKQMALVNAIERTLQNADTNFGATAA